MLSTDHLHSDPAYRPALRAARLARVSDALGRLSGQVCAWSRTTDTLRVPVPGAPVGFFLKRYFYPRWKNRLRGMLRGTLLGEHRARAEFELLRRMLQLGIPAVRPVAYGVRRVGLFVSACCLVTEEVPGAMNLTTFAADMPHGLRHKPRAWQRRAAENLARLVAEMHAAGFVHGQLFWRNILVRTDPAGELEYFLLDARPRRRGQQLRGVRQRWITELAQLAVSAQAFVPRSLAWRFLRTYLGPDATRGEMRQAAAAITHHARRWRKHEARRVRLSSQFACWAAALEREQQRGDWAPSGALRDASPRA